MTTRRNIIKSLMFITLALLPGCSVFKGITGFSTPKTRPAHQIHLQPPGLHDKRLVRSVTHALKQASSDRVLQVSVVSPDWNIQRQRTTNLRGKLVYGAIQRRWLTVEAAIKDAQGQCHRTLWVVGQRYQGRRYSKRLVVKKRTSTWHPKQYIGPMSCANVGHVASLGHARR